MGIQGEPARRNRVFHGRNLPATQHRRANEMFGALFQQEMVKLRAASDSVADPGHTRSPLLVRQVPRLIKLDRALTMRIIGEGLRMTGTVGHGKAGRSKRPV